MKLKHIAEFLSNGDFPGYIHFDENSLPNYNSKHDFSQLAYLSFDHERMLKKFIDQINNATKSETQTPITLNILRIVPATQTSVTSL